MLSLRVEGKILNILKVISKHSNKVEGETIGFCWGEPGDGEKRERNIEGSCLVVENFEEISLAAPAGDQHLPGDPDHLGEAVVPW